MKWFCITFILLPLMADSQVENLRILFFDAKDNDGIVAFFNAAGKTDASKPELKAYKGVATAMYAEVAESIADKLNRFNTGKDLLEQAVKEDWYNAEIRFLRFSVQSEVPFFLSYSNKLKEDAEVVLDAIKKGSVDKASTFWKKAIEFMLDSGELEDATEDELRKLKS